MNHDSCGITVPVLVFRTCRWRIIMHYVAYLIIERNDTVDRFSCKHNESNVNNDNEHDDYVEDDTDLSMMLFQKEN